MTLAKPTIDPKAAKLTASAAAPGILFAVAHDPARRRVYGAGSDGALFVVDLAAEPLTAAKAWPLHENTVSGLVVRGDELISCGYDGKLVWSDLATGKPRQSVAAHAGWVRKLVLSPDGGQLLTVGDDMRLNVWDAATGRLIRSLPGHEPRVPEGYLSALYALAISPDGAWAATGDRAGFVRVWDLAAGKTASEFRAPELYTFDAVKRARAIGGVRGLAFAPEGKQLAVSGIGPVTNVDGFVGPCRIELWDWRTPKRVSVGQDKHQAILNHVAFTSDGRWLIAAGGGDSGGALVFWSKTADAVPHVAKPKGHLQAFVVTAEPRLLAVGHGGFQVWQLA